MIWIIIIALLLAAVTFYDFTWSNVTNNIRNEVVFEDRHKSYGAYALRVEHGKQVMISFVGVTILCGGLLFASKFISGNGGNEGKNMIVTDFELENIDDPKKEEPIVEPKLTETQVPPKLDLAKLLLPKASNDDLKDTLNTQDDLKDKQASNVNMKSDSLGDPNKFIVDDKLPFDPNKEECKDCYEGIKDIGELQELPSFEGIKTYIQKNLKITNEAREIGLVGRIYVEFTVMKDGSIANVRLKSGLLDSQDKEAVRLFKNMPSRWEPGKINGHPVNVRLVQPIVLNLGK